MNILKSVNVALAKRGMSKRELATLMGLSPQTLSRIINRKRWSSDEIVSIAGLVGMRVSEFIALGED